MLKVVDPTFAVACFSGLLDIHECSGGLQMATSPLDKQTASCNSPNDWLMSLAMELAALCDMYVEVQMTTMDVVWLLSVLT